ncbi:chorismate synthase [Clostridium sp. cel8]|jgi:chorismate synthase|uniref:chorismate synthase n=1 Tax=unclassified Clostridium TaxID=2614128 RepID=UPI0015F356A8|nr:chorismate synthase [Clostridium sp. cel8]MBA5850776.1 chorismate synthase [Clostridium sp. cel8]
MSGIFGNNIKISIFGESHGTAIGVTINGLRPGIKLDIDYIEEQMKRRAPGTSNLTTSRKEKDEFKILSGYFNGRTTGTPLCAIIENSDKHSKDYERTKNLMRPGHADFTGFVKYNGFNDYRGGGHFSGRITAPLVFAGSICRKILEEKGIFIGSHIKSIGNVQDNFKDKSLFDPVYVKEDILKKLSKSKFPVIDKKSAEEMKKAIIEAKSDCDSIGGIIETAIINIPAGVGDPFFDSVESTLSHLLFSVPAVKGVEFGRGFEIATMRGSSANDEYYIDENGNVKTYTNNNGGILGGITNGMPVFFRTVIKPTASILKEQNTVDIEKKENSKIIIHGRHDPCIVTRAVPVIEAVSAIAILDMMY